LAALDLALLFFVDDRPLELAVFFELLLDADEEPLAVRPPLFDLRVLVVRLPPELDLLDVFRPLEDDELDRAFDEPPRPFSFGVDDVRLDFPDEGDIVSAAAPTAPTAAPATAPESISPAMSITLSTNFDDVDLRDPDGLRADDDELFLFDELELDLLTIVSPFIRN